MHSTTNIHADGLYKAEVDVAHGHSRVTLELVFDGPNFADVKFFVRSPEAVGILMAAFAKAADAYYGAPEPDWDAIAAEMDADHYMESVRGL